MTRLRAAAERREVRARARAGELTVTAWKQSQLAGRICRAAGGAAALDYGDPDTRRRHLDFYERAALNRQEARRLSRVADRWRFAARLLP